MTHRSRREIERALADLAAEESDTSADGFGTVIVYTDDDGYVTPDGDPVPTDAAGDPDPPGAGEHDTTIVLDGGYAPRDAGTTGTGP